jgi:transcriptional regulator GlxA family with amidase domain
MWCEFLASKYPSIDVDPDPIFIRDGKVYTSAGVTAGMDLALALREEDHGSRLALEVPVISYSICGAQEGNPNSASHYRRS